MKTVLTLVLALALFPGAWPAKRFFIQPSLPAEASEQLASRAAVEDERGVVALDQALREITNPFTVVCVSARPGDQDDGALAYVRKRLGARTVILYATRGEGEDSPTLPELDQELGAVRTREAIETARVIGSDLFFLNLRDIGYSKSADEVLSAWGHGEALGRMVRAIRSLRPDAIITNHDSKSGEGTGQAVARLALEAFKAAASSEIAPEAGSEAWQVRRYFQRSTDSADAIKLDLNEYDSVRGTTYAQIGLAARRRFFSRGERLARLTPERETSYYRLISAAPSEPTTVEPNAGLLGGLTLSEKLTHSLAPPRVGDLRIVDAIAAGRPLIDALIEKLIEKRAEGTIDTMHERYGPEFVRVVRFTAAIERALALALGVSFEVTVSDRVVVPGQTLSAHVMLRNGGARGFPVVFSTPERLQPSDKNPPYKDSDVISVGAGGTAAKDLDYEIAKDVALTLPHSAHLYDDDYYAIGSTLPGAQPAEPFGVRLLVSAEVVLGEASIHLGALARFDIASPVEISTIPFALVADWSKPRDISFPVRVRNRTAGKLAGALWVVPLALADDDYDPVHIAFTREDEEVTIKLNLRLPILKPPLAPDVLIEFRREKPAAPDPLGAAKIAVRAGAFEVVEGLKAGYLRGVDDWLSFALTELGVENTALKLDDISVTEHGNARSAGQSRIGCGDLARFSTIVVDNSAYSTHPELILNNRCFLRYVRQGGNLIVLSQMPNDWNEAAADSQLAPYPIKLSGDRITIENAAVKIIDADHSLMSSPNKITLKDFEGWIAERAVNLAREWPGDYVALLESSDPGEEPNRGSLLVARYGEGTYIYAGLSLRRQLLAGNAGAYRLFANLVSLPKVNKSPAK